MLGCSQKPFDTPTKGRFERRFCCLVVKNLFSNLVSPRVSLLPVLWSGKQRTGRRETLGTRLTERYLSSSCGITIMAQSIPTARIPPPPGHLSGICLFSKKMLQNAPWGGGQHFYTNQHGGALRRGENARPMGQDQNFIYSCND